ncbi:MAG: 3'-5' exonuclease [Paludibacteraceae bacterium]|nr:3'-5' exonuclease [Paludibacteraceae bacterium]
MRLKLTRPLIFFDLETTGINIATDRIVELSYHKLFPDGTAEGKTLRIKPTRWQNGMEVQMHIPDEAASVHGIHDEDVADCPTFKQVAQQLAEVFADGDLAGYNSTHFDIPLLVEEFLRAGQQVDFKSKHCIDAFTIFQYREPRTLTAAYRFYCGKSLEDAHTANADTMATYEVLMAQMEHYQDLPATVEELSVYLAGNKRMADFAGLVVYNDQGQEVFNFGKHKGKVVADVFRTERGYYSWLLDREFPEYTKSVFKRVFLSL